MSIYIAHYHYTVSVVLKLYTVRQFVAALTVKMSQLNKDICYIPNKVRLLPFLLALLLVLVRSLALTTYQ